MTFSVHQPDAIRYYTADLLPDSLVAQAFFSRLGGVSRGVHASLNMGLTVGDDPEKVLQNRSLAFQAVGRDVDSLSDSWLVHGSDAFLYRQPRQPSQKIPPKADIILTDNPDVTLFMRYADCVPIALLDPLRKAIALVHAGWQGTVKNTAGAAVNRMAEAFGSRPADLLAVIGPSIGPEEYEVGPEVVAQVQNAFGSDSGGLLPEFDGATHFDLWGANQLALRKAGVINIVQSGICTYRQSDEWFSHRASGGKTGRFGVLLALKD